MHALLGRRNSSHFLELNPVKSELGSNQKRATTARVELHGIPDPNKLLMGFT